MENIHSPKLSYNKQRDVFLTHIKKRIIINPKNLIYFKYLPAKSRLNCCCGKDEYAGNNIVCQNNHEIGTEMSDCWQLRLVALDPT